MSKVHILNIGVGNVYNVYRAFIHIGADPLFVTSPDQLVDVKRLVLPGVGAFGDCVRRFREIGFEEPVLDLARGGIPLFGICVGMQMLAEGSEEFGHHRGLGLIPGQVKKIADTYVDGAPLLLPHICWAPLDFEPERAGDTPLAATSPGTWAYFVHSFAFSCYDPHDVVATCGYGGHRLTAAVGRGNVFGTQFHPEKSGEPGLDILREFMRRT